MVNTFENLVYHVKSQLTVYVSNRKKQAEWEQA